MKINIKFIDISASKAIFKYQNTSMLYRTIIKYLL